jgi:hypothetical protein
MNSPEPQVVVSGILFCACADPKTGAHQVEDMIFGRARWLT